jgi:hypothetical protein
MKISRYFIPLGGRFYFNHRSNNMDYEVRAAIDKAEDALDCSALSCDFIDAVRVLIDTVSDLNKRQADEFDVLKSIARELRVSVDSGRHSVMIAGEALLEINSQLDSLDRAVDELEY